MISLVKGDITKDHGVQAIVNAANQSLLGGGGVDGAIHRAAGPGLLEECQKLNGCTTGNAKITGAYNLPCEYVIHTVGPIVQGRLTKENERLLASCYRSILELADQNDIKTLALCCISTGVFMFPNQRAAEIAVETVRKYLEETGSQIKVIFNVFKDIDLMFYKYYLGEPEAE